jgi:hypothetical protein
MKNLAHCLLQKILRFKECQKKQFDVESPRQGRDFGVSGEVAGTASKKSCLNLML